MRRGMLIVLLTGALALGASAQQVIVRRALPPGPIERKSEQFEFVLPTASVAKTLAGPAIQRTTGQEYVASYRPVPDWPWVVRFSGGGRVEDAFSNGRTAWGYQFVAMRQRGALVAQFNETNSLEAALESQARFDQSTRAETSHRVEMVMRTAIVPGLSTTVTLGRAALQAFDQVRRDRTYLTLTAEQKLPFAPVRLALSPGVAREVVLGAPETAAMLTAWSSSLFLDVTPATIVGATFARLDQPGAPGGIAGATRTFAGSVEQRLDGAALKVTGGYEEQTTGDVLATTAMFLGLESSFSVTETLTGTLLLRQRALEFYHATTGPAAETVVAVSVGGDF